MTTVHPDLERLEQQYDQLVAAAEAGHITQADAVLTLAGLTVNDAAGAVWAINADGDYVRSPFPGAPAQRTDPAEFATQPAAPEPFLPTPGGFPTPAGPVTVATHNPFAAPAGFPAPPTVDWNTEVHDPLAAPPAGFSPDVTFPTAASGPAAGGPSATTPLPDLTPAPPAKQPRSRSINDATGTPLGAAVARAKDLVVANKVLVGIAAAGVALFLVLSTQSDPAPATKLPTGTGSTHGVPDPTAAPLPSDTPAGTADQVPSKATAVQVLSALSSTRRDLLEATLAAPASRREEAKAAALWAGVEAVGLKVTPGAAVAQGQGAVQDWVITDGATTVATVKVTWLLAGNQWKLAALPTF